ncbi:MAG: protein-glutamate O-methyltransferase CheR [Gammaproteobacteria bacterium]|nr:protein-glutamate O-methyltransferase CheR [Gammaproteobacteria bacterium]
MPEYKQGIHSWETGQDEMSDVELSNWLELLEQRTGISLPSERQSFLLNSLDQRIREIGLANYQSYYQYLNNGVQGELEWELLVDRLTVHETRFMRDEHALALITQHCLPQFQPADNNTFNVWSVGCATGEEPYSFAMSIDNYFRQSGRFFDYNILATDISLASLITAQWGIYMHNRGKNMPEEFRQRYVKPHDNSHFKVNKVIRDKVKFSQFNLLALETAELPLMDVMVCQNVLIYFKQQRRRQLLDHMVRFLKPGGMLILGAGEVINWKNATVKSFDFPSTLAFQRKQEHELKQGNA